MKNVRINLFILVSLFISFGMKGQLISDDFNISAIKGIKLMGNVNVTCVIDSTCVHSTEYLDSISQLKERFFLSVNRDVLTIQTKEYYEFPDSNEHKDISPIVLKVSPKLNVLENGYNSLLEVKGTLTTSGLIVKLSGNGTIKLDSIISPKVSFSIITGKGLIDVGNILSDEVNCNILGTGNITIGKGTCEELKCKTAGTGKMNLLGLHSPKVRIRYSGGGYVKCWASESLKTSGLGTTKITYLGNPHIKRKGPVKPRQISNCE